MRRSTWAILILVTAATATAVASCSVGSAAEEIGAAARTGREVVADEVRPAAAAARGILESLNDSLAVVLPAIVATLLLWLDSLRRGLRHKREKEQARRERDEARAEAEQLRNGGLAVVDDG